MRHGIPEEVVTKNGLQFDSNAFCKLSKEYQFHHLPSSLYYYQRSNGEAERRVKTTKALLKEGDEQYLVLLAYRSNPFSNGYLLVEIMMNRKLIANVSNSSEAWKPHVPNRKLLVEKEEELRLKEKVNFDRRQYFLEIWYGYQTEENKEP